MHPIIGTTLVPSPGRERSLFPLLSLSFHYQPWSDLNRSQKISFNHCWRGAVGRARTKSRGEAREGDEDPTCSLSPPLRSGILFPRLDPTSRAWLVRLSNLLLSNVSRNVFINGIGFRLVPPPLLFLSYFFYFRIGGGAVASRGTHGIFGTWSR